MSDRRFDEWWAVEGEDVGAHVDYGCRVIEGEARKIRSDFESTIRFMAAMAFHAGWKAAMQQENVPEAKL